ncbi:MULTISPECIES: GTP cyclohydrolase II [Halomonas]|uniref:GTP cyclohydrolase-2 n=3 Tax=Halomonas TaxID=2745 RepID=A0AAU7KIC1_9GAMM|nr:MULTISPECIES: GTP cyclohydrolase II [Halomonas]MBR9771497.1 GTP cyclohydrolase II [Gammaproteobacteria bacterium]MCO7217567.1 GTP cyclohydrolase II [Halomonas sp. OfavH-34-E]KJZ08762.1 GTP cyclohydrolase [Halomonas sp. S2151]MAR73186.1 GTP cyclohydrolase II [Halomonas sp.]MBR9880002.1 GTP cyclohydrolase II [Gammaproteobacteria bacterium]
MTIRFIAASRLPTPWATFTMHGFEDEATGKDHIALTLGEIDDGAPVLGRVHSECLTGDALFSMRCDCGYQLQEALKRIASEGRGVILYLRQEGRGIGLLNKIRAYHLQDQGADTVEANERLGFAADLRRYDLCVPMLEHLGVEGLKLMTNNPRKVDALTQAGVQVVERVALTTGLNPHNEHYLSTKAGKLGHMMALGDFTQADDVDIEKKS